MVAKCSIAACALIALAQGGCRTEARFSTGPSQHYEGQVVNGDFVRSNIPVDTKICLTLDADHLQDLPGNISTSDGRFTTTPLRQIPQIWQDPLSTLQFGEGRERNLIYMAAPTGTSVPDRTDVTVVLSLMDNGDAQVRLFRGAPASPFGDPNNPNLAPPIFGVFDLTMQPGSCPPF